MTTEALLVHMARDVVGIVRGYLDPIVRFTRPFRSRHCMVCGAKHMRVKTNLCNKHADLCGICAGPHPKYSDKGFNCAKCVKDRPWMSTISNRNEHLMARLYFHRDELDFGKFDIVGAELHKSEFNTSTGAALWDAHRVVWALKDTPNIEEYAAAWRAYVALESAHEIQRNHVFNRLLAAMEDRTYTADSLWSWGYIPPKRAERQ